MQLASEIEASIVNAVREQKRAWLKGGVGTAGIGWVLAIPIYASATPPPGVTPLMVTVGTTAFFCVLGAALALFSLGDPSRVAGLELLRGASADRLVWLFAQHGGPRSRISHVTFGFDDGKMGSLPVLTRDADEVVQALRSHAPRALVGFSEERLQRYHRAPQAFAHQTG